MIPVIVGAITLFIIIIIIITVIIICRRHSTSSKAADAAMVVSSASPGTAASSALLASQRASCGSSVMTTPHQFDKRQLHHQYAELRERPSGVVTHCSRLSTPPTVHHQLPTSINARSTNLPSPYSTYSSISRTGLPVTAVSHLYQPQQAYQLQQQQVAHLQYHERC